MAGHRSPAAAGDADRSRGSPNIPARALREFPEARDTA